MNPIPLQIDPDAHDLDCQSHGLMDGEEFERFVLASSDEKWALWNGMLRPKPGACAHHNDASMYLAFALANGFDRSAFRVRHNQTHLRHGPRDYLIPDVLVIPTPLVMRLIDEPDRLEVYDEQMPFLAEIWSPLHEPHDIDEKITEYMRRGHAEIWRLDPYEQRVMIWRRVETGGYDASQHRGGLVTLQTLPNMTIDVDDVFDFR